MAVYRLTHTTSTPSEVAAALDAVAVEAEVNRVKEAVSDLFFV